MLVCMIYWFTIKVVHWSSAISCKRPSETIGALSHRPTVLTDTIDYRTIGFSHNRPNSSWHIIGTSLLDEELISYCCLFLLGRPLQKSLRLCRFKFDWDEIWCKCSSCKYSSTNGVKFLIRQQNFNTAAAWHDILSCSKVLWVKNKHLPCKYAASPWVPDLYYIPTYY